MSIVNVIVILILCIILFLLIDIPMITIINKKMYMDSFYKINNNIMNTGKQGIVGAILAYILLAFAVYYFIIRDNKLVKISDIFIRGCILGLVIYGVYNTTNLATINNYSIKVSIVDTIWGSLLMGLISILSVYIIKRIKI